MIEQEGNAVLRVPRRVEDLTANPETLKEGPTLPWRDDDVPVHGDVCIALLRFDELLHAGDPGHLQVYHQQRNTRVFQVLGRTGMIDVVVRGESKFDLVQRNVGAGDIR